MLRLLVVASARQKPTVDASGRDSLVIFALALTRIDAAAAGRAYAAYGGIYILSSLLGLWLVEKTRGPLGHDRRLHRSCRDGGYFVRPPRPARSGSLNVWSILLPDRALRLIKLLLRPERGVSEA